MDDGAPLIDVDAIANIAFTGINRAWLFMGLGVNCANDAVRANFDLPDAG